MPKKTVSMNELVGEVSNQKMAAYATMMSIGFGNVNVSYKNQRQIDFANAIDNNTLTFSTGEAGTGKSFVALYKGLELLSRSDNQICKMYLAKSTQVVPGEELGFLPGDLNSKMSVFIYSMKAIVSEIVGEDNCELLFERGIIEILPLAFLRGVTIRNSYTLFTEAQNVSPHTMKTILTRIGEGSKMVCDGDLGQIDMKLKAGQKTGLEDATDFLPSIPDIGFVKFLPEDCVRSEIVKAIVQAYRIREGKV